MGDDLPEFPDVVEVELDDGETVTVRETQDSLAATAGLKRQLEQYEPANSEITITATKPEPGFASQEDHDTWVKGQAAYARAAAEWESARRLEQHMREDDFGEDE